MKVAALFAGIAGVELGLEEAGHKTLLFCEIEPSAKAVLGHHFKKIPLVPDIRDLTTLPKGTQLITAGFPCQDLSQAGGTAGINGKKSGIVTHLFDLLRDNDVPNVLIENVPFMLQLQKGQAVQFLINSLEDLGYKWAYRVVDALAFGLPQRRERVFLLASKKHNPWNVLFESEHEPCIPKDHNGFACGFYWTEGTRGLGWAVDAVPTLKGGSTIGIPSPPAIWLPSGRIVRPGIRDAERLQGFPADWTKPAEEVMKKGHRWKLVGNAVSVKASRWIGDCLNNLPKAKTLNLDLHKLDEKHSWPSAAFGSDKKRFAVKISKWPCCAPRKHLADFIKEPEDLSYKAVTGFLKRLTASSLRYPTEFKTALLAHQKRMEQ